MVSWAWTVGLVRPIFRSFVNGDGSYQRKLRGVCVAVGVGKPLAMDGSPPFLSSYRENRSTGM